MEKGDLLNAAHECQAEWASAISQLGEAGLQRPGAVGPWRVRDVIAHFNGWDRWQLVQLRSAFTGEVPTESELLGGLHVPKADPSLPFVDGMNASIVAANHDRPLDAVVGDWRELCGLRVDWIAGASQEQLDATVGSDWRGTPGRYIRLQSEVAGVGRPRSAAEFILDQVEHQRDHLTEVRHWMTRPS